MWFNDCCDKLNWYGRDWIYHVRLRVVSNGGTCIPGRWNSEADVINPVPTEGYIDELTGPGGTGF
jgi:hypothetical protein